MGICTAAIRCVFRALPLVIILSVVVLLLNIDSHGDIHYVNVSNSVPAHPYTNWSTASTSIQEAVDAASDGDTVLVTNGTYLLSVQIVLLKDVRLRSVNGAEHTTVSGARAVRCVYLDHTNATVDGFTLTRGSAFEDGAGVYSESRNATQHVESARSIEGTGTVWAPMLSVQPPTPITNSRTFAVSGTEPSTFYRIRVTR